MRRPVRDSPATEEICQYALPYLLPQNRMSWSASAAFRYQRAASRSSPRRRARSPRATHAPARCPTDAICSKIGVCGLEAFLRPRRAGPARAATDRARAATGRSRPGSRRVRRGAPAPCARSRRRRRSHRGAGAPSRGRRAPARRRAATRPRPRPRRRPSAARSPARASRAARLSPPRLFSSRPTVRSSSSSWKSAFARSRVVAGEHPVARALGDERGLEVRVRTSAAVVDALRELERVLDVLARLPRSRAGDDGSASASGRCRTGARRTAGPRSSARAQRLVEERDRGRRCSRACSGRHRAGRRARPGRRRRRLRPSASSRAPVSSSTAVRTSPSCSRAHASPERARTSSSTELVAPSAAGRREELDRLDVAIRLRQGLGAGEQGLDPAALVGRDCRSRGRPGRR